MICDWRFTIDAVTGKMPAPGARASARLTAVDCAALESFAPRSILRPKRRERRAPDAANNSLSSNMLRPRMCASIVNHKS